MTGGNKSSYVIKQTDLFKNTHREKASSNKIPTLTKRVFGTANQLFIRGTHHSICLNNSF